MCVIPLACQLDSLEAKELEWLWVQVGMTGASDYQQSVQLQGDFKIDATWHLTYLVHAHIMRI